MNEKNILCSSEVTDLIKWANNFFGESKIKRFVQRYKRSLSLSKYVYSEYYLKKLHPWSEALLKLNKKIDLLKDKDVVRFLTDIKMIKILENIIPHNLMIKYKRDLLDTENAVNFLFELQTAWQYYKNDFEIQWYIEDNKPEFEVRKNDILFDVECKRINVDKQRQIKRSTFYRFIDCLLPLVKQDGLSGKIELKFKGNIPKTDKELKNICKQMSGLILKDNIVDQSTDVFTVSSNTFRADKIDLDFQKLAYDFYTQKPPNVYGILITEDRFGNTVSPLEIIVSSMDQDHYLLGIYETLKNAITNQLQKNKAGLLSCFIPEIYDFSVLDEESSLFIMTRKLFLHENFKHLVGIVYVSDQLYYKTNFGVKSSSPILKLFNNNCEFLEVIPVVDSVK